MTTLFMDNGDMVGVTVIEAGRARDPGQDQGKGWIRGRSGWHRSIRKTSQAETGQFSSQAPMRYLRGCAVGCSRDEGRDVVTLINSRPVRG
jgi:hypothetical protein